MEKVTITDVAAEGKAIARVNDMVVFVPFVAPGDVGNCFLNVTKTKRSEDFFRSFTSCPIRVYEKDSKVITS